MQNLHSERPVVSGGADTAARSAAIMFAIAASLFLIIAAAVAMGSAVAAIDGRVDMTLALPASNIITIRTGTEITPLMTALQNSALIGSIGLKVSATPPSVAKAMIA